MKIKVIKTILPALFLSVAMTSCIDETSEPTQYLTHDIEAIFHGNVVTNGSFEKYWERGAQIGVTIDTDSIVNYPMTSTGYGGFTSNLTYYFTSLSNVRFTAYYPYNSGVSLAAPTLTTTLTSADQTNSDAIDFMFAEQEANPQNPRVDWTFYHAMSKIRLVFHDQYGNKIENSVDYIIDGLYNEGVFNTQTGEASGKGTGGTVISGTIPAGSNGDIIIFPQPEHEVDITINIGGQVLEDTITIPKTTGGTIQIIDVEIIKIGSESGYDVTYVPGTIEKWEDEKADDVEAGTY